MLHILRTLLTMWRLVPGLHKNAAAKTRLRRCMLGLFSIVGTEMLMPRLSDCPVKAKRMPEEFAIPEFHGHFKFRKHDFYRVLAAIGLTQQHTRDPIWLRVGSGDTKSVVRSDWALAVLIKRLATGCRYRDVQAVMGGSKTALCVTFLHMLELLFNKYRDRLGDLKFFRHSLPDFVRLLNSLQQKYHSIDCPYDNVIGLVDGHFVATNRPGGDGCVVPNMYDTDVFNGKTRLHGLKYQGLTTPLGICILHGPYGGPESDSGMLELSQIENDLAALTAEWQQQNPASSPLCVYGDSAYRESMHVVKALPWALATAAERELNDIMKPVRVLVEQNFACIGQIAGICHVRLSLGSGPVGMVFPVAVLLTNMYAILYGNTVTCSIEGALDLLSTAITIEDYLAV